MSDLQIFQRAREIIADPKHFLQDGRAYDKRLRDNPTRFCLVGAVEQAYQEQKGGKSEGFYYHLYILPFKHELVRRDEKDTSVFSYNDKHTHAEVLELLDAVIERAEDA